MMGFLTALVAFAVTMLILSTTVTAFVQVLHRVRHVRERHLRHFLAAYFDKVIWARLGQRIDAAEAGAFIADRPKPETPWLAAALRPCFDFLIRCCDRGRLKGRAVAQGAIAIAGAFVLVSVLAKLAPGATELLAALAALFLLGLAARYREGRDESCDARVRLREAFADDMTAAVGTIHQKGTPGTHLSPVEFAQRLAGTPFGKAVLSYGEDELALLVTDLVRRFDSLGDGATESFRELSRRWSIRLAFVLAICANVDAVHLMRQYIENPSLSEAVAAEGEEAGKKYLEVARAEEKLEKELAEAETKALAAEAKSKGEAAIAKGKAEEAVLNAKDEWEKAVTGYRESINSLAGLGVPIGPTYYPFCQGEAASVKDLRCKGYKGFNLAAHLKGCEKRLIVPACEVYGYGRAVWRWAKARIDADAAAFTGWLLGVLVAGALIGLGGPFWFDVYRRLASILQVARGIGLGKPKEAEPEKGDGKAPSGTAKPPDKAHAPGSAVEAFRDAARADRVLAGEGGGARPLLAPDGTRQK